MIRRRPVRPPSAGRGQTPSPTKVLAWIAAGVVAIAGVAGIGMARAWSPSLGTDLCPADRVASEEVLVILDATDEWNAVQQEVISQQFSEIQTLMPRFARMSLFTVRADPGDLPAPELQLCNPGKPEDFDEFPILGGWGARVFADLTTVQERWDNGFHKELKRVLDVEAQVDEQPRSPLMETFRAAAIQVFGDSESRASVNKSVYVFSDMLQNSAHYSHYVQDRWEQADARRLADLAELGTVSLEGAQVTLFLLHRPEIGETPGRGSEALVSFWGSFFSVQGAEVIRVRPIEG